VAQATGMITPIMTMPVTDTRAASNRTRRRTRGMTMVRIPDTTTVHMPDMTTVPEATVTG
jgi:hypothetical protein